MYADILNDSRIGRNSKGPSKRQNKNFLMEKLMKFPTKNVVLGNS